MEYNKCPEIDPKHLWSPTSDKGDASVHWGEDNLFSKCTESIGYKGKMMPCPLFQITHKKSVVDLNIKVKTRVSNENIGEHLYKLEVNRYFLNRTQTKEKLDKVIYLKIKAF